MESLVVLLLFSSPPFGLQPPEGVEDCRVRDSVYLAQVHRNPTAFPCLGLTAVKFDLRQRLIGLARNRARPPGGAWR